MNRENIKKEIPKDKVIEYSEDSIVYNIYEVHKYIDEIFDFFEPIQKENTRLKKQLANNHHIECMCSFCKPIGENVNKIIS